MLLQVLDSAPRPAAARLAGPVRRILQVQTADGAIPWFENGPWDAWNHVESVLALNVAGEVAAARLGMQALVDRQLPDGSFLSGYGNALPMADRLHIARVPGREVRDTNFTAYIASAALQLALLNGPQAVIGFWPAIRAAIGHVLGCQHPTGDISWCAEAYRSGIDDSLRAGNASIFASIGHAIKLAEWLDVPQPRWVQARRRLGQTLRAAPRRFDRRRTDRSGFAMDWYYPVLAGLYRAVEGRARLHAGWRRFVAPGLGCRCVAAEPWVTVAESCELAIACRAVGMHAEAAMLLNWVEQRRDTDEVFWMGWQDVEKIDWPAEKPAWTQAAYVLAVDAVEAMTPAAGLFLTWVGQD
jgi:hypothetical protein